MKAALGFIGAGLLLLGPVREAAAQPATASDAVRAVHEQKLAQDWADVAALIDEGALEQLRLGEICAVRAMDIAVDSTVTARLQELMPGMPLPDLGPRGQAEYLQSVYAVDTVDELASLPAAEVVGRLLAHEEAERTRFVRMMQDMLTSRMPGLDSVPPESIDAIMQMMDATRPREIDIVGEVVRGDTTFVVYRVDRLSDPTAIRVLDTGGSWGIVPQSGGIVSLSTSAAAPLCPGVGRP